MKKRDSNIKKVIIVTLLLFCFSLVPVFGEWEPDQRLTNDPGVSYTFFNHARNTWCIAANGDTVHIVWCSDLDDPIYHYYEVYYKRSIDGGQTWGETVRLSFSPYVVKSGLPTIAVKGSMVHVAWTTYVGNWVNDIYYRRSANGGETWDDTLRLTHGPDSMRYVSTSPTIAVKGSNVYVVYTRGAAPLLRGGNSEMICYRCSSNNGVSWGSEVHLTNGIDAAISPSVAVSYATLTPEWKPYRDPVPDLEKYLLRMYKAHIVWSDSRDGTYNEIYYQCVSNWAGGTWPCKRLTYTGCASWQPSVAVSGSKVHVVWEEHTHTVGTKIFYKRSTNGGKTWGQDIPLIDMGEYSYALNPSIAVSGSKVHVVWENFQNGSWLHYKRSTNAGSSWEPDTCLTFDGYYWSRFASVAVSGPRVHLVWTDYRDDNCEIYYKRNPTGNLSNPGQGPPEELTDNTLEINEISESGGMDLKERLNVFPNPFVSYAVARGYEEDDFLLYDATGRLMGTYKGKRIGENVSQGVYFLTDSKNSTPVRIIKLK